MSLYELLRENGEKSGSKIQGVAVGIVTNNKDPEGLGRVKVKLPWREESDETHWARVVTLMAGKDRGSFFLPEVGDEVLVAFDQGNINHVYVIGSLWNGNELPPETNSDGKNNIRKIKSRSGHEIVFNDDSESKKEKVEIRTKAGHTLVLDDSSGTEMIEIKDKTGNNSIVIDSVQNSLFIKSDLKIEVKSQSITLEGSMIQVKADSILELKGAMVKIN